MWKIFTLSSHESHYRIANVCLSVSPSVSLSLAKIPQPFWIMQIFHCASWSLRWFYLISQISYLLDLWSIQSLIFYISDLFNLWSIGSHSNWISNLLDLWSKRSQVYEIQVPRFSESFVIFKRFCLFFNKAEYFLLMIFLIKDFYKSQTEK